MLRKRVLVTGGAGFIGSHIARALHETGEYQVAIADDLSGGFIENVPKGVRFFNVDLRYDASTKFAVNTVGPQIIVHCAANAREGASYFQPRSIVQRNTLAFTNVLSYALNTRKLEKLVCTSSMSVYGDQEPPFSEDMPLKPVDIYGMQKAVMEQMLKGFAEVYGFKYTIIRPHNVMGENQSLVDPFRNVFGIWMNRIMRGEPVVVFGDGKQQRAFSYIEDSLPVYIKAITEDLPYDIINVGGFEEITINEALSYVKSVMGVPEDYPTTYLPDRPKEVKYAYCEHDRMLEILDGSNYELVGWKTGVLKMAQWAKSKGPQEWKPADELEIEHPSIPKSWK
jgi:UDP-glucose 4-epimerase